MVKRIFIDTETSGLSPKIHQILSIGLVITEEEKIIYSEEYRIKIQQWAKISAEAMKVNKIDLKTHNENSMTEEQFIKIFKSVLQHHEITKPQLHGQNVNFDIRFLEALYERQKEKTPWHYHYQDTMIMARMLKDAGKLPIKNVKLETICEHFGIKAEFHNAKEDTIATAKAYFKLLNILKE